MDFKMTLTQLSLADQIETFSRILNTQNDFQNVSKKLNEWINNHRKCFTPEHVDELLLINRNITKIGESAITSRIIRFSLKSLLSYERNQEESIADLAAPLISTQMKRDDLETIIRTFQEMPNYHWDYHSFFLNLNILFGYQPGEKVNAAIAIRPLIQKNMKGDDVKKILKGALKLPRGTRENTLALASQLIHNRMSGRDAAQIMAAVDQLEKKEVISEISTSQIIHKKMRAGDVIALLKAAVKLPEDTRKNTLALTSQLIHDGLPGRDAAEIMAAINQLESEVNPKNVVAHTATLLDFHVDGWHVCRILQTIAKFPPEEREHSKSFSLYSESGPLIDDFRKVPLKERPQFSKAVCSFMTQGYDDLPRIFEKLIGCPLKVIRLTAPFASQSDVIDTLDLMKQLADKIDPKAAEIIGLYYSPRESPLKHYLNALLQLPIEQQYEIAQCASLDTKTLESFYRFLMSFLELREFERIEIARLLNARRQPENHSELADIFEIVSVFLKRYIIYDYQMPYILSAAKHFGTRCIAEKCFPLFDLLDDVFYVPKIFDKISCVSFAFTLDSLLKVLKGRKIRQSQDLLTAVEFTITT